MAYVNWTARMNTTQANRDLDELEKRGKAHDNKQNQRKIKLMQIWSMSNQLATLMLNQATMVSNAQRKSTISQGILFSLQLAQQEIAIGQVFAQASLALVGGHWGQFGAYLAIAAIMQRNLINIIRVKAQQREAERRAGNIQTQIEAYQSS